MELGEYAQAVRRRWWLPVLGAAAGLVVGLVLLVTASPTYSTSATVLFSYGSGEGSASELNQGAAYVRDQLPSFVALAGQDIVLAPVVRGQHLSMSTAQLVQHLTVTAEPGTSLLSVRARDSSAPRAAALADAVAASLVTTVQQLAPTAKNGAPSITGKPVVRAAVPTEPGSGLLRLPEATLVGLVLGALAALGREVLDPRLRGAGDVARASSLPVLGSLTRRPVRSTRMRPAPDHAEQVRQLRTVLLARGLGGDTTRLVLAAPADPRAVPQVSVDLAIALAEAGHQVALVEADLRRPALQALLGLDSAVGLTQVLQGEATLEQAQRTWGSQGILLVQAGAPGGGPSELLGSQAMADLLAALGETVDVVLLVAGAVNQVTDATVTALQADATVLVVDTSRATGAQLRAAEDTLELAGAPVLGVVLSQAPSRRPGWARTPAARGLELVTGSGPRCPQRPSGAIQRSA